MSKRIISIIGTYVSFLPDVKSIGYGKRSVKVTFEDGSVVESHCAPNDTFDLRVGFSLCMTERLFGSKTKVKKAIEKYDMTKYNNSPLNRTNRRANGKAKAKGCTCTKQEAKD